MSRQERVTDRKRQPRLALAFCTQVYHWQPDAVHPLCRAEPIFADAD